MENWVIFKDIRDDAFNVSDKDFASHVQSAAGASFYHVARGVASGCFH